MKALDIDPARRYFTAKDFADELARYLEGQAVRATGVSSIRRWVRRFARSRAALIALAGGLILGAAAVVALTTSRPAGDPERERSIARTLALVDDTLTKAMVKSRSADPDIRGLLEEVFSSLEALLKRYPDAHQAQYRQGVALHMARRFEEAEEAFTRSIEILPTAPAHFQRGRLRLERLLRLRRWDLSMKAFEETSSDVEVLRREALGDFREAERLNLSGDDRDLAAAYGEFVEQRPERTIEICTSMISEGRSVEDALLLRGWARSALRRMDEAVADYGEVLRLWPDHPLARRARAGALGEMGRRQEAVADLLRILEARPDDDDALCVLARNEVLLGRSDDALRHALKAVELRGDWFAEQTLATIHARSGRFREALAAFDRALERVPRAQVADRGALHVDRGWVKAHLGDREGAMRDYDAGLDLAEYRPGYINRGDLRRLAGDSEGALKDYQAAVRLEPDLGALYFFTALAYADLGREEDMLADLGHAIEKSRPDPMYDAFFVAACKRRAEYYERRKAWEKARDDYARALERIPEDAEALARRGLCHFRLERWSDCAKDLEAAGRLDPELEPKLRRFLLDALRREGRR